MKVEGQCQAMKVDYLTILALLTACSLFGISYGQYYYGYNYRMKNYSNVGQASTHPNPKRYFSTSNHGLAPGWYRSKEAFWKTVTRKMYDYQEGLDSTTMMTAESPGITTTPYPTQDGMEMISPEQSFPSTMQPVTQDVQQPPYVPQYPEATAIQSQPTVQDISSLSPLSSSSAMSLPMSPATQEVTSAVAAPADVQPAPVQSVQQQTTMPTDTQQLGATTFPHPQSRLISPLATGSRLITKANFKEHKSSRICNPGPPLKPNPRFKNCLVVGDSIALGYLKSVKFLLSGKCQVQHAPFARGSGALDSRHGLKCLSLLLKTTAMEPTTYDVILFNFGMHDIDYSKRFPEEHVPFAEYKNNILKLKQTFLKTGAKVAFALTTPFPSDKKRDDRIKKYNAEAVRIMESGHRIPVVDLYSLVVKRCGKPTYDSCSIMRGPRDVHYNDEGNQMLGVRVAATFATLLNQGSPRRHPTPSKGIVRRYFSKRGYADYYIPDNAITCPDAVTRCPLESTCCESLISLTGYGCCMIPNAVNCPDNWHCCPGGSTCSPTCNVRECKCITYTTVTNGTKVSKESKAKAKYLQENNLLNGETGEHFGKNFKLVVDPLLRVLKKLANAHKITNHHLKKNAQMWKNKLFESKGKLKFKNVKSRKSKTRKAHHKATLNRNPNTHSINIELGHLIEHHHKHGYKNLKKLFKMGVEPKAKVPSQVQHKTQHHQSKQGNSKDKVKQRKPVLIHKSKKLPKHRRIMVSKKRQFHKLVSHQSHEGHHHHNHYYDRGNGTLRKDTTKDLSKSHDQKHHQGNHGTTYQNHHIAANQSQQTSINHNQSFKYKFIADRKTLMKKKANNSHANVTDTSLKTDKGSQGAENIDDHYLSSEDSGSGEGSGLRDINAFNFHVKEGSGSGQRDNKISSINPYHGKQVKEREQKLTKVIPNSKVVNSIGANGFQLNYFTTQFSKKTANITSSESKNSTAQTSGTGALLSDIFLPDSQGSNAERDYPFDDINPSDGHAIRDSFEESNTSGTSGELLGENSGEIVDDSDDHGFDLMSSALMENNGAKNEIIEKEQSAGKRQHVANGFDENGELLRDMNKNAAKFGSKGKSEKSPSFIDGEDNDVNVMDDIRGKNDGAEFIKEHNTVKSLVEDEERVDLDDNKNLVSLDSLLEHDSGDSSQTQSESFIMTLPSESQNHAERLNSDPELVENPAEGLASGYSDDSFQSTMVMRPKTGLVKSLVEGSASGNPLPKKEMVEKGGYVVEKPVVKPATLSTEKGNKMTTNSTVESSETKSNSTAKRMTPPVAREKPQTARINHATKSHSNGNSNFEAKRLRDAKIQHPVDKKKKTAKKATKKTFVGKLPKSIKNNYSKTRRKSDTGSRLELKDYSKRNRTLESTDSLSLRNTKNKAEKTKEEKKLSRTNSKKIITKNISNSKQDEDKDDISNENLGDDKASHSYEGSGRETLEAYLAMP